MKKKVFVLLNSWVRKQIRKDGLRCSFCMESGGHKKLITKLVKLMNLPVKI